MQAPLKFALIACSLLVSTAAFRDVRGGQADLRIGGSEIQVAVGFEQDAEMLRVERRFSQGSQAGGLVAPRVWSSRLEIRWTARWEAEPRFAV